jgi:hypothetical protein
MCGHYSSCYPSSIINPVDLDLLEESNRYSDEEYSDADPKRGPLVVDRDDNAYLVEIEVDDSGNEIQKGVYR